MSFLYSVLNIIYEISQFVMPIFIVVLVFNSGISEHPMTILKTIKENWFFYLKLILYNNIALPFIVWFILQLVPIDPIYTNGLVLLFLAAGASTVIAFLQMSKKKVTYAVTTMILLTFMTVIFIPIILPILIEGAEITSLELVQSLVTSVLIPLVIGMGVRLFTESLVNKIKPYVQSAQKILMNIAIYGMMIGLLPEMFDLIGSGMIVTGTLMVLLASAGGYLLEIRNSDKAMQLTSGFAGGQRNGAVAFAVAINNFTDPTVLLTIAIISSISTVIFSLMANYIGQGKTSLEKKEVN